MKQKGNLKRCSVLKKQDGRILRLLVILQNGPFFKNAVYIKWGAYVVAMIVFVGSVADAAVADDDYDDDTNDSDDGDHRMLNSGEPSG